MITKTVAPFCQVPTWTHGLPRPVLYMCFRLVRFHSFGPSAPRHHTTPPSPKQNHGRSLRAVRFDPTVALAPCAPDDLAFKWIRKTSKEKGTLGPAGASLKQRRLWRFRDVKAERRWFGGEIWDVAETIIPYSPLIMTQIWQARVASCQRK